jgi:hypothetical protein
MDFRTGQDAHALSDGGDGWTLAPESLLLAEQVALLALQQASDNDRHGAEDLHAIYVRPSDAELNSHVKG